MRLMPELLIQSISEAAACAGRLEAPGKETAEWLAGGCGGLDPAARCALGQEMSPEGVAQALADIEAAAARVESAFAAIHAFEDAHPTNFKVRQCALPRQDFAAVHGRPVGLLPDLHAWSWGQKYVSDLFSDRAVDASSVPGMPLRLHQHHL